MYKRLIVLLMLILIGTVRSQETLDPNLNLLTNGNFSNGLTGWDLFNDIPITVNSVTTPYKAAHFTSTVAGNEFGGLQQGITVDKTYYILSFYLRINSGRMGLQVLNTELTELLPNNHFGEPPNCTISNFCGAILNETRWYTFRITSLSSSTYTSHIRFVPLSNNPAFITDVDIYLSDTFLRCLFCNPLPTQTPSVATPHPLSTQPPMGQGNTNGVPGVCIGSNCIDPNSNAISDRICTSGVCGTQSINAPNFPNLIVPTPRSGGDGGGIGGSDGGGTSGDYDNSEIAGLFEGALGDAEIDVGLLGINGLAIDKNIFGELTLGNTTWIAYVKGFFQGQGLGAFQPLFTLLMVVLLSMLFINLTDWIIRPVSTVMGLILKVYRLLRSFIPFL